MSICSFKRKRNEILSSFRSLSHVRLFATPWTAGHQACLSITNSRSLLKLMSTASVRPSNHLILCRPLLLPPSIFPSIRVFYSESVLCMRWPTYWSFSVSISPSNECSGLTSFRIDYLDLLAVQGTLKSLRHSSKASTDHQNTHNFEILNKYIFITCEKARYTLYKLNHTNMYAQLCV